MAMGSEVKHILKSLCFSYGWSYAVFWSYDPINPMLLRFKEAYNDEKSLALVDDMILQPHILGQGIVGEAALTGNHHQWLFSDTLVLLQCEHEFQNQFLSGLKTIAIIPIRSSGVVQLGSTQKILESPEILEQITRAVQEMCLKPDQSVDLDTLFESLVPLGDYEIVPESSLQGLSFDDIFSDNNPPSLLSLEKASEDLSSIQDVTNGDDFGFDILKSYSLDDLYQLLADSPEQTNDHKESSVGIQGNDYKDLYDALGMNSDVSSSHLPLPPKGLFSDRISSSLSNSTCSSLATVQDYNFGVNQSKRKKLETSPSFYPEMRPEEETVTPKPRSLWIDEERSRRWSIVGNEKKTHEEKD